jgi:hypothetical protein
MLIEVTEKKTIEVAVPFFAKDETSFYALIKDDLFIRVSVLGQYTSVTSATNKNIIEGSVVEAIKAEPITATEFYFALDKAAQILVQQCKR